MSQGGGFSGIYTGYSIRSDGQITSWRQTAAAEKEVQATETVKPKKVRTFFQQMEPFTQTDIQAPGNITTKLVLQQPDTTYTWLWDPEMASSEQTQKLNDLYTSMLNFCQDNLK